MGWHLENLKTRWLDSGTRDEGEPVEELTWSKGGRERGQRWAKQRKREFKI